MGLRGAKAAICGVSLLVTAACTSAPPSPATPSQSIEGKPSATSALSVASPRASPATAVPSRAALIEKAVADGQIDQVTGLVYRAFSTLGLPNVPLQYTTGSATKDDGVFADMVTLSASLSAADRARFAPFLVRPTDAHSIFGPASAAASRCSTWVDSGSSDGRFKVWGCADADANKAHNDVANAGAVLNSIWGAMTQQVPDGMGTPMADTSGPDATAYGGDGRIDVYLVDLGSGYGAAVPAAPFTNPDGSAANTSSGFILLNRTTMSDDVRTKQDAIHGLFHVLQFAHSLTATHANGQDHWFDEASATWAQTFYYPAESQEVHALFVNNFQTSTEGLESMDVDHQYGAYIWPFFAQQQSGPQSMFNAWAQIGSVAAGDLAGVTAAIDQQDPFDQSFREFAVRNLNISDVLDSAGVTTYSELDRTNFPTDKPPTHIEPVALSADGAYTSTGEVAAALGARYWNITLAPSAQLVTISITGVTPSPDTNADVLLHHTTGTWERRMFNGGEFSFCREHPGQSIDALYLIVSDPSPTDALTGAIEASAAANCS